MSELHARVRDGHLCPPLRRFRGFDWNALMHKKLQAPIVPHAQSEDDTSYFDEYPEEVSGPRPPSALAPRREL